MDSGLFSLTQLRQQSLATSQVHPNKKKSSLLQIWLSILVVVLFSPGMINRLQCQGGQGESVRSLVYSAVKLKPHSSCKYSGQ